jgi:hypothetical protein
MSSMTSSTPIFWVGLDVHKDSLTAAVFRGRDPEPMRVDRLPNDHKRIRRYFQRLCRPGAPGPPGSATKPPAPATSSSLPSRSGASPAISPHPPLSPGGPGHDRRMPENVTGHGDTPDPRV